MAAQQSPTNFKNLTKLIEEVVDNKQNLNNYLDKLSVSELTELKKQIAKQAKNKSFTLHDKKGNSKFGSEFFIPATIRHLFSPIRNYEKLYKIYQFNEAEKVILNNSFEKLVNFFKYLSMAGLGIFIAFGSLPTVIFGLVIAELSTGFATGLFVSGLSYLSSKKKTEEQIHEYIEFKLNRDITRKINEKLLDQKISLNNQNTILTLANDLEKLKYINKISEDQHQDLFKELNKIQGSYDLLKDKLKIQKKLKHDTTEKEIVKNKVSYFANPSDVFCGSVVIIYCGGGVLTKILVTFGIVGGASAVATLFGGAIAFPIFLGVTLLIIGALLATGLYLHHKNIQREKALNWEKRQVEKEEILNKTINSFNQKIDKLKNDIKKAKLVHSKDLENEDLKNRLKNLEDSLSSKPSLVLTENAVENPVEHRQTESENGKNTSKKLNSEEKSNTETTNPSSFFMENNSNNKTEKDINNAEKKSSSISRINSDSALPAGAAIYNNSNKLL